MEAGLPRSLALSLFIFSCAGCEHSVEALEAVEKEEVDILAECRSHTIEVPYDAPDKDRILDTRLHGAGKTVAHSLSTGEGFRVIVRRRGAWIEVVQRPNQRLGVEETPDSASVVLLTFPEREGASRVLGGLVGAHQFLVPPRDGEVPTIELALDSPATHLPARGYSWIRQSFFREYSQQDAQAAALQRRGGPVGDPVESQAEEWLAFARWRIPAAQIRFPKIGSEIKVLIGAWEGASAQGNFYYFGSNCSVDTTKIPKPSRKRQSCTTPEGAPVPST